MSKYYTGQHSLLFVCLCIYFFLSVHLDCRSVYGGVPGQAAPPNQPGLPNMQQGFAGRNHQTFKYV